MAIKQLNYSAKSVDGLIKKKNGGGSKTLGNICHMMIIHFDIALYKHIANNVTCELYTN